MSDDPSQSSFMEAGLEYLISGRFAIANRMIAIAGNLYHHGIEYILKSYLLNTMSVADIRLLGHNLVNIWNKTKSNMPNIELNKFDSIIQRLNLFERIRYPDRIIREGAIISFSMTKTPAFKQLNPDVNIPVYELSVEEIEELVSFLIAISRINIKFYVNQYGNEVIPFLPVPITP